MLSSRSVMPRDVASAKCFSDHAQRSSSGSWLSWWNMVSWGPFRLFPSTITSIKVPCVCPLWPMSACNFCHPDRVSSEVTWPQLISSGTFQSRLFFAWPDEASEMPAKEFDQVKNNWPWKVQKNIHSTWPEITFMLWYHIFVLVNLVYKPSNIHKEAPLRKAQLNYRITICVSKLHVSKIIFLWCYIVCIDTLNLLVDSGVSGPSWINWTEAVLYFMNQTHIQMVFSSNWVILMKLSEKV